MTPPPSPEPAPVTDARAEAIEEWMRTTAEPSSLAVYVHISQVLADRARTQEQMEQEITIWAEFRRSLRTVLTPFWRSNPMVSTEEIVDAVRRALLGKEGSDG